MTIGSASHAARSIWRWSSRLRKSWKTQKLGSTGRWANWPRDKRLPTVRGTVGQVLVDHLPDGRKPPKDLWLWHAGPVPAGPDLLWKAYAAVPVWRSTRLISRRSTGPVSGWWSSAP